jgi:putative transcriptional regulator
MMGERKLKIADITRELGINRGTLTRLYYETAERVDLAAVSALCAYFDCQIGDLLEFVHDEQRAVANSRK